MTPRLETGLKARLANGGLTVGSWMTFQFPPAAEIMGAGGFDWMVVDLEHTTIDLHDAQVVMMILENQGVAPWVRVGENDPLIIKRVLDAGAHGIVVPNVRSPEEANRAVQAVYYPPRGSRGAGLARAQAYGLDFSGYRKWLTKEVVLVVQVEHFEAVDALDEILAVEGVDAFMIGPYDLSASLGYPGEFENPEVQRVFAQLEEKVRGARKPAGIHIVHPDIDALRRRIAEGYRLIAYGDDMIFFSDAVARSASAMMKVIRG